VEIAVFTENSKIKSRLASKAAYPSCWLIALSFELIPEAGG